MSAPAPSVPRPLSILTDYGRVDEFAGILHLVIARIAPATPVVDLTHDVPRFDIGAGAMTLWRAAPWLAPGVVLAVVDPGVATSRRPVALETVGAAPLLLVGPDNGLLVPAAYALGGIARGVVLDDPTWHLPAPSGVPVGATFAGRDVFAPVAAHLSAGVDLGRVGSPIEATSLVGEPLPEAVAGPDGLRCTVTWVDHFGNVEINAGGDELALLGTDPTVQLADGTWRGVVSAAAFADVPAGAIGLVTDSVGRGALCLDRASAATALGLGPGDAVMVRRRLAAPS